MKWVGVVACVLLAVDCAAKALGADDQALFSADALWVWWLAAIGWVVNAVAFTAE